MKKDFEVGNVEQSGELSGIETRMLDAYQATLDADSQIDEIEKTIAELEGKDLDICNAADLISQLNSVKDALSSVSSLMTGKITSALTNFANLAAGGVGIDELKIASGVEDYMATGIILKKFQILKYKIEKINLCVERIALKVTGSVLKWTCDGKGSLLTVPIQGVLIALAEVAQVVNVIITALGVLLSLIDSITVINVKSASTALFLTPKSMMKQDISIINANQSTTNNIPEPIDKLITATEESIKKANGEVKKTKIAACASAALSSASNGNVEFQSVGDFEKFDPQKIRNLVKAIMLTLVDADAVPRYEKLSITNPRFMFYLITGFEPKAHASFGIPGFP